MCTITKIYKNQSQKASEADINEISQSGLINGRGRDAFSITTFSNTAIVSVVKTRSYEDAMSAISIGLDNDEINKIIIYSRARPETEIEMDITEIQPMKLQDGGCMYHHGVINTINDIQVPENVVDTVYLAQIYNSFKQDIQYFKLSPDSLVLLEYPGDVGNQSIEKLAWYKFDYSSKCISKIYTNIAEAGGKPLWLD